MRGLGGLVFYCCPAFQAYALQTDVEPNQPGYDRVAWSTIVYSDHPLM